MEKTLNHKITQYLSKLKRDLVDVVKGNHNDINLSKTVDFIYSYDNFNVTKDDLQKRKRVKNSVPFHERCKAKKSNNCQCTRRKKITKDFVEHISKVHLMGK